MTKPELTALFLLLAIPSPAQIKTLKPGWNLFSPQQDVQLGKEASAQVQQKMRLVHNAELDRYLNQLLDRLKQSPHAGRDQGVQFPFTIHAVYDKNINAFSLPGGPLFVNTGLILACDNEAQLAGVIGHEMSHVVLRHSTNQISKRNLIQIPAILAGAVAGGGMMGQLAQAGVGLGANSVLLKFSRGDESQADYNGALIAAEAGYNPLEMAHFFEKLEEQSGKQGMLAQMLSDHPNPGNRVQAVESEIQQMPQMNFDADTGQFPRIQGLVRNLTPPKEEPGAVRPSAHFNNYRGDSFSLSYPDNWQVMGGQQSNMVTIAPRQGGVQNGNNVAVGYGLEVSYYLPPGNTLDLNRDTQGLIKQLMQQNPGMGIGGESKSTVVDGHRGLVTRLTNRSPLPGQSEVDTLVTVARPEGLFYMVFIAPASDVDQIQDAVRQVIASVRFSN